MPRPEGVFDVLSDALARTPDAPALVTRSGTLTYAELDAAADQAAGALAALGVRTGDRVAASLPNDQDLVVAFHATMRLAAIWVGVSLALAPPEKAYILGDSGARLVLADDGIADALSAASDRFDADVVRPSVWREALAASGGRPAGPAPDPEAPAAIAYTSGTTGFPKGAVHGQAGLLLPGRGAVARRGWGPELRKGDSFSLTILNLQILTTLLTAQAGGTAIVMDAPDVTSIVDWIRRERVTVWNGPPAQLWTMVRDESIAPADLSSLTEVWVGGADCPDRLRQDFESRFGIPVSRTYGLTEAPALVCLDDLVPAGPEGTSGRPLDHIAVDTSDGEIVLGPAAAGGYRPALGYWGQPPAAGRTLRTGDLGRMEDSGHLRVLGRKSTVIIRGGANIYPAEVERVLADAPGVGACAVVGIADERLGERVGAAVEQRDGRPIDLEQVASYCRENLAAYKVPELWSVVDRLPRNQMGKVPSPAVVELITGSGRRIRV
ncbi:MAG TPA: AMP-binding protein [Acidimicrobiales bacterium]|nr:AMP-binding protein [Acidimicrobiales bacterium]